MIVIYIAGPMAGIPDLNRPAFAAAARALTQAGLDPRNPHDITLADHPNRPCPNGYAPDSGGHSVRCWLKAAVALMLTCDEVFFLCGWPESTGARVEFNLAVDLGMSRRFE